MTTYVDASVLLRMVQGSAGSLTTWPDLDPVSSQLIRVECLRVIDRAHATGASDDVTAARDRSAVLDVLATFALAAVSDEILERASDPFPTALGTLDAVHLATALALRSAHPDLNFATHDRELATAARAVGFVVAGA